MQGAWAHYCISAMVDDYVVCMKSNCLGTYDLTLPRLPTLPTKSHKVQTAWDVHIYYQLGSFFCWVEPRFCWLKKNIFRKSAPGFCQDFSLIVTLLTSTEFDVGREIPFVSCN